MENYLAHISFGCSIPFDNPHAVSVSFPVLQDVIAYEQGNEEAKAKMKSGYPRFFRNKYVDLLTEFVKKKFAIPSQRIILPITSVKAKGILESLLGITFEFVVFEESVFLLFEEKDPKLPSCIDLIRNTGCIISSRKAEETLFAHGLIESVFLEPKRDYAQAKNTIVNTLSEAYGTSDLDSIYLTNSGVNALFAANEAVLSSQRKKGKTTIVQLGWLYVDSVELISKRCKNPYVQVNVHDLDHLEHWLQRNYQSVAVLVTESVTNPLLHCVDLPKLYEICQRYEIKLIVDNTLGTAYGVGALSYCDVLVESLTKFACGYADVLMGLVIVKAKEKKCQKEIEQFILPPFAEDLKRLGVEILGYESRVQTASQQVKLLETYLRGKSQVKEVFSVLHPNAIASFKKIQKKDVVPGLLSVVFDQNLAEYYDRLRLAKGPSLGTEFTLAMPYVYLAHYDYLTSHEGLKKLETLGLDQNLLRISVGSEPIEDIIEVFEEMFEAIIFEEQGF